MIPSAATFPSGLRPLVIASHNRRKAREMERILSPALARPILTLADFPGAPEPEETGMTYEENATIKARAGALATGEEVIADDAGLEVDALDGAPGLYSKRFGGEALPFPEKIARLLQLLKDVPDERRTARFRCWVALALPGEESVRTFEGVCEGSIARKAGGSNGFGYDPIFVVAGVGRRMAELSDAEKDAASHRGVVLAKALEALRADERP